MRRKATPAEEPRSAADSDSQRRLFILLIVVALIGVPAGILRALCVGNSCERPDDPSDADVPFCSLPDDVRARVQAGYREGRSPDLVAVGDTAAVGHFARVEDPAVTWPTLAGDDPRVPLVFYGTGVAEGAALEDARLDRVAPTVARVMGLQRPHPEVRSGRALDGLTTDRARPARLVVLVVWKGIGSADLEAAPEEWPYLSSLLEGGSGTLDAEAGSLPADPAAVMTTIGTGGLPHQHGITGTFIRNDNGKLTRAWSKRAPVSVIAALGDDLDERMRQRPLIGVVGTEEVDRGLIGGNWYIDVDRDVLATGIPPARVEREALEMLERGFGRDQVPDLMAVAGRGTIAELDRTLRTVVRAATRVSGDNVSVVVTATGSTSTEHPIVDAAEVEDAIEEKVGAAQPVVEALVPGGVFVNQRTLVREELTEDEVLQALFDVNDRHPGVVADAFPGLAISFARYC